ncbi:MAG: hypothetical protein ACE10M_12030 [Alphaproteobacteria bacterium]
MYLDSGLRVVNFHHSDLDPYEAKQRAGTAPPGRYDSFAYVERLKDTLGGFGGLLAPHRVVVYQTLEQQENVFRRLAAAGIGNVVLVGKPYTTPPEGTVYRCTVEDMLAHLRNRMLGFHLGVIGIHSRRREPERIARKFETAGRRLRVMGQFQFLDDVKPMTAFLDDLARAFATRKLGFDGLEWNVGLAILALKDRTFYAKLLRKDGLACEDRFSGLRSVEERIEESVRMNLEFAARVREKGQEIGLDIGFSIQPLIERSPDGAVHPGVYGALELAKELDRL